MDVRELYQAELRWQLYKELPLWAADPDLGEHSNRMIFFELHDEPHAAYFAPQFPY